MLEACVDETIVGRNEAVLIPAMEVDAVCVEEEPVSEEKNVKRKVPTTSLYPSDNKVRIIRIK